MDVWSFILSKLNNSVDVQLLYVLQSEGSSPGRQGFKMAIAADGEIWGTIGGGIMEFKLVEKAKAMLLNNESAVLLQHQYHDKEKAKDQSGMICSGSQLNVFVPLLSGVTHSAETVKQIITAKKKSIRLSPDGLGVTDEHAKGFQYKTDSDWLYSEAIKQQPVIHIIGGGHVGLALSELMQYLDFYIKLYDDRTGLNTITANTFAHEKLLVDYENIISHFDKTENDFVVIMTVGYRTDKIVLKQLINKSFFYIGLLGSDKKINQLNAELKEEGFSGAALQKINAPIGINILSKTSKEIAVSIAAEIIGNKNKNLPTGRNY